MLSSDNRIDEAGRPTPAALAEEAELQRRYPGYRGVFHDYVHAGTEALERWWDRKFGLRIHWSLYSITGSGPESWPLTASRGGNPELRAAYEALASWWNPSRFDAEEWCEMMTGAGIRYFTFTTKHHDGFSMYATDTRVRRRRVHLGPRAGRIEDCNLAYSIMEGPFGRDITGELVAAGRRHGLGIGLYFSHIDWFDSDFRLDQWNYQRDPAYSREQDPTGFRRFLARHRAQILELCRNYGPLDLLSLDMSFPDDGRRHGIRDELVETIRLARRLQPGMLIRRRGIDPYGDYRTPERVVPSDPARPGADLDMPWQVIYPGGRHFSHVWADEYKPASWIIENLVDIVAKGGNFQVGYGPGPDGRFAEPIRTRLAVVGAWLKLHGEGIYGTRPHRVFGEGERVRYTRSRDGRQVYAFVLQWPEAPFRGGELYLSAVQAKAGSPVRMLGVDHEFRYRQDASGLHITLPGWLADPDRRPSPSACAFRIDVDPD